MRLKDLIYIPFIVGISIFSSCEWGKGKESLCKKLNVGYCDGWGKDYDRFLRDFPTSFSKMDSLDETLFIDAENFVSENGHDKTQFRKDLGNSCYDLVLKNSISKDFTNMPNLINIARRSYGDDFKTQSIRERAIVDSLYKFVTEFDCGVDAHFFVNIGKKLAEDNELAERINEFNEFAKDKGIYRICEGDYGEDVGKIK